MDKTILEKRIQEKAEERFDKDVKNLVKAIVGNPIGKNLNIKIGDNNTPLAWDGPSQDTLLNIYGEGSSKKGATNLDEIKKDLLEKYKREETDNLLGKLDQLQYMFEEQRARESEQEY